MHKIEVDTKSWTIRELLEMYKSDSLAMDIPVQRGVVWDNKARSLYIHSVLLGILAVQPPFVFSRHIGHHTDSSIWSSYSVLDGKQRLTTLIAFANDEFRLVGLADQPEIEGLDLSAKKYTELSASLIQQFLDTSVVCTVVTDPTAKQEDIIFTRLNNNKSMSAIDRIRPQCKATISIVDFINRNSTIFHVMFSSKQLLRKPEFEIVLKSLMMLAGEQSLSSSQMLIFAKNLQSDADLADIEFVYQRALRLHEELSASQPDSKSFISNKAVFLALIPYLNNRELSDEQLKSCIGKLLTERLAEFKTGSSHSPTGDTLNLRMRIISECL